MRINRIIATAFIIICVLVIGLIVITQQHPVNTEKEAQIIANEYIQKQFGDEFSNCSVVSTNLEDDFWVVTYMDESVETKYLAGGGYPIVWINQNTGRVTKCLFQK